MAPSLQDQHEFLDFAKNRNFAKVMEIVEKDPEYINVQPACRWSALHQAAEAGDGEAVKRLVAAGANLNALSKDGLTPKDVAAAAVKHLFPNISCKRTNPMHAPENKKAKNIKSDQLCKLTVQLASGELFAAIEASESKTVQKVKDELCTFLQPGREIISLLHKTDLLDPKKTLDECGLSDNAVLSVVIAGTPTLHLFQPCSSSDLAGTSEDDPGRRGCMFWNISMPPSGDFQRLVIPNVQYGSIKDVSPEAREVAEALHHAFPGGGLSEAKVCSNSEDDDGGEVFVIANPGADLKSACLKALAIDVKGFEASENGLQVNLEEKDWKAHSECGFNFDPDDAPDDDDIVEGFVNMTNIMAEKLTNGFTFTFDADCSTHPMLYGGYASDGSIVGVLTSRCWS